MKIALSFDDVLLVPRMSKIQSRKEVDLSTSIRDLNQIQIEDEVMTLPIISSRMDTVTGEKMMKEMHYAGGLGVAHRYCSIEDQVASLGELAIRQRPLELPEIFKNALKS